MRRQGQPFLLVERVLDGVQPEAVLCCAPETFMRAAASLCTARDIRADNIWLHIERSMPWSSGLCGDCRSGAPCPCPDGPVHRYDRYRPPVDDEAPASRGLAE
ncbi:hypothetical protein D9M70_606300 [compost metagenome]